jgi:hypothetical protein
VRILVQRKTGDTYGVDLRLRRQTSDVIKTHVKENKLSTDVLLKESINAIVRDMMKTAKIKHPEHTAD